MLAYTPAAVKKTCVSGCRALPVTSVITIASALYPLTYRCPNPVNRELLLAT